MNFLHIAARNGDVSGLQKSKFSGFGGVNSQWFWEIRWPKKNGVPAAILFG